MDREIFKGSWTPNISIQGKIYHLISSLRPEPGFEPKVIQKWFKVGGCDNLEAFDWLQFGQIYIHDNDLDEELNRRLNIYKNDLDPKTMAILQDTIHKHNSLAKSYKSVSSLPEDQVQDMYMVLHKGNSYW